MIGNSDVAETAKIPIICGPTGSGKTAAAIELAAHWPLEIVSADSRQVIKRLDIGTAKPTPGELAAVRFHLIDLVEPGERYTAFRFIDDANAAIRTVLDGGKIPVVVGGTGLYLRALTEGVVEIENQDMAIRDRLEREMETDGPLKMHARLEKIDPLSAAAIHPNNRVRIIRALEIFYLTGKSKSELAATGAYKKSEHEFEYFCLMPPRPKLYADLNARVDSMMQQGLLDEVRSLVDAGLGNAVRKSNVIGYMEMLDYLDGKHTLPGAVNLLKQNTRRYAKRQVTWFRHQTEARLYADGERLKNDLVDFLKRHQSVAGKKLDS